MNRSIGYIRGVYLWESMGEREMDGPITRVRMMVTQNIILSICVIYLIFDIPYTDIYIYIYLHINNDRPSVA